MSSKLSCPRCTQKTVGEMGSGYSCANCGQAWGTIQAFIRDGWARSGRETPPKAESPKARPTATGSVTTPSRTTTENENRLEIGRFAWRLFTQSPNLQSTNLHFQRSRFSKDWFERLNWAFIELLLKLAVFLLKVLPKLIFRLTLVMVNTVLLALLTYPVLFGLNLFRKVRGRKLSPEKRRSCK